MAQQIVKLPTEKGTYSLHGLGLTGQPIKADFGFSSHFVLLHKTEPVCDLCKKVVKAKTIAIAWAKGETQKSQRIRHIGCFAKALKEHGKNTEHQKFLAAANALSHADFKLIEGVEEEEELGKAFSVTKPPSAGKYAGQVHTFGSLKLTHHPIKHLENGHEEYQSSYWIITPTSDQCSSCDETIDKGDISIVMAEGPGNLESVSLYHQGCFKSDHPNVPTLEDFSPIVKPKKVNMPKICLLCKTAICEVCAQCETEGCAALGIKVCDAADKAKYPHLFVSTQKARGFLTLAQRSQFTTPTPAAVITSEEDIASSLVGFSQQTEVFVRPCPVRPRHGFVESRPVQLAEKPVQRVREIFAEARAEDPQAELLLLPYIKSDLNMVLTPTRLAIGAGHDGATAGKGTVTVPLMGTDFSGIDEQTYTQAGVDTKKDDPYFEIVTSGRQTYWTQLRAGAKLPPSVGKDFIPKPMTVLNVVEASNDLLVWEKQVKTLTPGTVVVHVGGSLISHYGVHCLYNNVPIMTSRRPQIGERIQDTGKAPSPSVPAVAAGLAAGIDIPIYLDKTNKAAQPGIAAAEAVQALLVTLHNAGAMTGDDGFWLGAASAFMMRTGMAAAHGEARHKQKTGLSRSQIHMMTFKDYVAARSTLGQAWWLFRDIHWGGGYGGPKWANCTEALIELDTAILSLLQRGDVANLVNKLNNAVNQAHNNGWWLNKFTSQSVFDQASKQNLHTVIGAGPVFHKLTAVAKNDKILKHLIESKPVQKTPIPGFGGGSSVSIKIPAVTCNSCSYKYPFQEQCPNCGAASALQTPHLNQHPGDAPNVNVNGTPLKAGTKIVVAQAKFNKSQVHMQYQIEGMEGYFSDQQISGLKYTTVPPTSGLSMSWCAGSDVSAYVPLQVHEGGNDSWTFTNDEYGISFNYKLKTTTQEAVKTSYEQAVKAQQEAQKASLEGVYSGPGMQDEDEDEDSDEN